MSAPTQNINTNPKSGGKPKPKPLTPMKKTEFLETFTLGIRFVKNDFIKQEVFYNNIMKLLCISFKNAKALPKNVRSVDESVVENSFVSYVKGTNIDTWGMLKDSASIKRSLDYINDLKSEYQAYKNAAIFDSADILVGAVAGKVLKVAKVVKATPVKKGQKASLSYGKNGLTAGANLRINLEGNKKLGRDVMNIGVSKKTGKFGLENIGNDRFNDMRRAKKHFDVSVNTTDMGVSLGTNTSENFIKNDIAFSYGNEWGNGVDIVTDFIPVVGNTKAVISTGVNAVFAGVSYKNIKNAEKSHLELIEKQKQFFKNTFIPYMEKDIRALNKTKLYRMYLHLKQENKI